MLKEGGTSAVFHNPPVKEANSRGEEGGGEGVPLLSWLLLTKLFPSSVVPDCCINGSSVSVSCTELTASYRRAFGINDSRFCCF